MAAIGFAYFEFRFLWFPHLGLASERAKPRHPPRRPISTREAISWRASVSTTRSSLNDG